MNDRTDTSLTPGPDVPRTPEEELTAIGAEVPTVSVEHVTDTERPLPETPENLQFSTLDLPEQSPTHSGFTCCGDGSCGHPEDCPVLAPHVMVLDPGVEVMVLEEGDLDVLMDSIVDAQIEVTHAANMAAIAAVAALTATVGLIGAIAYLVYR